MQSLKGGFRVIDRKGLYFLVDPQGKRVNSRPWLGDTFSFLYDRIMEKSVFPKKFAADPELHYDILTWLLHGIHGKNVLEIATGSGSAARFLRNDNRYVGTDISPGLLKLARKRLVKAGFREPELYVVSADALPFADHSFDLALCMLSLNFFGDAEAVFRELRRVLKLEGIFVCSVPVPERASPGAVIHGTLRSEDELRELCERHCLHYESLTQENGALLYFRAKAR